MSQWPRSDSDHVRAYVQLKEMLVEYRFRPGEQLLIGPLADQLRVSLTPVRETLIRLRTEALLDSAPKRGFFAKALTTSEMTELCQLNFLILKCAIERRPSLSVAERTNVEIDTPAVDVHPTDKAPHLRHKARIRQIERAYEMIAYYQNRSMASVVRNVHDRMHYIHLIDLETPHRLNEAIESIEEIFGALERRDASRAVSFLEREFEAKLTRVEALVKEGISRVYTEHRMVS